MLLVILIVLLVLLLLVLFSPIVYKAKGVKQEQINIKARISWLFPLIYGKIHYDEEKEQKFSCIFYLLGIPVYDALAEKKTKKEKEKKIKRKTGNKKANKEKFEKEQTGKKQTDGEKLQNIAEAEKVLSEQADINTGENTEALNHWEDLEKLEALK